VSAWFVLDHCSFATEPSGPGMPTFIVSVSARIAPSRRPSMPIFRRATLSRTSGSSATPRSRASSISSPSDCRSPSAAAEPSPARSFISVVIATFQPLPTPPTTFSSGT
jgi:hypothetical protein